MAAPTATVERTEGGHFRVQGLPARKWATTTPGRLGVASIVLVVGLVVVAVVGTVATAARNDAARAVGLETVPALVAAEELYGSLADADATASTVYLLAGLEPPELRDRYERSRAEAGRHLSAVANAEGTSASAQAAVRRINRNLPQYAELIGDARFNSRQGLSVGAQYQKDASTLMREKILPDATTIYLDASKRLDDNYDSGTSPTTLIAFSIAGILIVGLLVAVQVFTSRRTRRILNVSLVVATGLVVLVVIGAVLQFSSSQNALVRAQEDGSDSVQLLSSARILTQRMSSDESQTLIERGTGDVFVQDFEELARRVDGDEGLLPAALRSAADDESAAAVQDLRTRFAEFVALHDQVRSADDGGDYDAAVDLSTEIQAARVRELDGTYEAAITAAQGRLDDHAGDARRGFSPILVAIPVMLLVAAGLVVVGLRRRISEYA
jgi:hypothetical protein